MIPRGIRIARAIQCEQLAMVSVSRDLPAFGLENSSSSITNDQMLSLIIGATCSLLVHSIIVSHIWLRGGNGTVRNGHFPCETAHLADQLRQSARFVGGDGVREVDLFADAVEMKRLDDHGDESSSFGPVRRFYTWRFKESVSARKILNERPRVYAKTQDFSPRKRHCHVLYLSICGSVFF